MIRILLASLHLLGLGIGLGAVWTRASALHGALDPSRIRQALVADTWWGLAAALWIATGLLRWLGGVEKATGYYTRNHVFLTKMGLLALILVLEVGPMMTLIKWRKRLAKGEQLDTAGAPRIAVISYLETGILLLMVLAATAMARGYGTRTFEP